MKIQNRASVDLSLATRLLNLGPTTLVSSAHAGKQNVMAVTWAMPLDFNPPKVLAVINSECYTRELIEASGEFAINIPSVALAKATMAVGSISGRNGDKFSELGLTYSSGQKISSPLVDECLGWLECRVISEPANQKKYDLFIGEVVAAWADPDVFSNGCWHFKDESHRTIHYLSDGAFFSIGEPFVVDSTSK